MYYDSRSEYWMIGSKICTMIQGQSLVFKQTCEHKYCHATDAASNKIYIVKAMWLRLRVAQVTICALSLEMICQRLELPTPRIITSIHYRLAPYAISCQHMIQEKQCGIASRLKKIKAAMHIWDLCNNSIKKCINIRQHPIGPSRSKA